MTVVVTAPESLPAADSPGAIIEVSNAAGMCARCDGPVVRLVFADSGPLHECVYAADHATDRPTPLRDVDGLSTISTAASGPLERHADCRGQPAAPRHSTALEDRL